MQGIINRSYTDVRDNFWLAGAKVLHKIAKFFGGEGNFMKWAGLHTNLNSIAKRLGTYIDMHIVSVCVYMFMSI